MRIVILLSAAALILTSFFQVNPGIPTHMMPSPCKDPCSTCRIDSMEREYRWGRATLARYESFKNDELARIKSRCDTIPPCDETIENCGCPQRSIELSATAGNWEFWEVSFKESGTGCNKITGSEKLRLSVSAPEAIMSGTGRPFRFITRINPEGVLPFENEYPAWQSGKFELEMPDGCASIDCFVCPNVPDHNINKDRNVCTPLDRFLKRLEAIKSGEYSFSAVVPGQTKTWLVRTDATIEPIPAIRSEWFTKAFRERNFLHKEEQVHWQDCLKNLAWLGVYDPNFKILDQNIKARRFLVRFNVGGRYYEIGVHSGGFFYPLKGAENPEFTKKLMFALTANTRNIRIWRALLRDWLQDKKKFEVTDFIPSSWTGTDDPLNAVGRQTTIPGLDQALLNALNQHASLDLVLQSVKDNTHKVWRSDGDKMEEVGAAENLLNSPNRFLRLLVLSDLNLKILAQNAGEGKLVFIYKQNTKTVWSWVMPPRTALQNFRLLKGEVKMAYSGQSTQHYIERLAKNVSDDERVFLLAFANNPGGFQLVDWYPYSPSVHVTLYTKPGEALLDEGRKIYRLSSQNGSLLQPIVLRLVGTDWANIPAAYTEWKRASLADAIYVNAEVENIEIWLSQHGIGFSRKEGVVLLDVFPTGACGFTRIPLTSIERLITEAVYKGATFPDRKALFKDWLVTNWDRDRWRANPIGVLARCQ